MLRTFAKVAAWGSVGFIVYATLVPLGMRPTVGGIGPDVERFAAYAGTAALMVLAYPRYPVRVALMVVAMAAILEISQLAIPDRDARVADAMVKMAGGLCGLMLSLFLKRLMIGNDAAPDNVPRIDL
jgi:VanZ family protein